MGLKADKTERVLLRHEGTLLKEMFELNRFSRYLIQEKEEGEEDSTISEQIRLQAICLSELGRVLVEETDMPTETAIKGLEYIFEKKKKKWRGQNSIYFLNRLTGDSKHLTSYNLASILKRISTRNFGIEKRKVKNHWHYMSNGYKEMIRRGVLW